MNILITGSNGFVGKNLAANLYCIKDGKNRTIHMLPGYTHNIINLSETESLVTVMWANEQFDPKHPDTFFEKVEEK